MACHYATISRLGGATHLIGAWLLLAEGGGLPRLLKTFKGGNSRTIYKSLKSVFLRKSGTERAVQIFFWTFRGVYLSVDKLFKYITKTNNRSNNHIVITYCNESILTLPRGFACGLSI